MFKSRGIFLSAIGGNIIEYYDFTAYAIFVPVISQHFFPHSQTLLVKITLALATFATGFIVRPIGGIFFGYIGDILGRKKALLATSFGMGLATLLIGIIPKYETIGYLSPTLLIFMRLIQGLCISGEGTGTAIFLLEHFNKGKPGLITSIIQSTSIVGTLIVSALASILSICTPNLDELIKMRIIFIIGGILGLLSVYTRTKISETIVFRKIQRSKANKGSLIDAIKIHWKQMALTFVVASTASSLLQLLKGYICIHFSCIMGLSLQTTYTYTTYTSIAIIITTLVVGMLIDKIKSIPNLLIVSSLSCFVLALPTIILISQPQKIYHFIGLFILATLASLICTPAYIFVISMFEPKYRFLGVSFSYNLGIAVFGGTSPIISKCLVDATGITFSPAIYLMFTSASLVIALYLMRNFYIKNYLNPS